MKIGASYAQLASVQQYMERRTSQQSLRVQAGDQRFNLEQQSQQLARSLSTDSVTLQMGSLGGKAPPAASTQETAAEQLKDWPQAKVLPAAANLTPTINRGRNGANGAIGPRSAQGQAASGRVKENMGLDDDEGMNLTPEMNVIRMLLEKIYGVKLNLHADGSDDDEQQTAATPAAQAGDTVAEASSQPQPGWGIAFEQRETYYEAQMTSFVVNGTVKTADGKQINIALNLSMSREYYQEQALTFRAGNAVDPLVVNYEGTAAQLTDIKFSFDLNTDGTKESLSTLSKGSGYLVLDRDNNGKVNDGSELFGPKTGSGFEELARYDEDHNGWIDENDAIYDQLRLWQGGAEPSAGLSTLNQENVGAICLENVATPFALKNANNDLLGRISSSGIYLRESGAAGTVQQLDLAV